MNAMSKLTSFNVNEKGKKSERKADIKEKTAPPIKNSIQQIMDRF